MLFSFFLTFAAKLSIEMETGKTILRFLKDWTLPVAIAVGTVVYLTFDLVPALDEAGNVLLLLTSSFRLRSS